MGALCTAKVKWFIAYFVVNLASKLKRTNSKRKHLKFTAKLEVGTHVASEVYLLSLNGKIKI